MKASAIRDNRSGRKSDKQSDIKATKDCPVCGLPFSNRRKWQSRGLWDSIVYCSDRCRRQARQLNREATPKSAG